MDADSLAGWKPDAAVGARRGLASDRQVDPPPSPQPSTSAGCLTTPAAYVTVAHSAGRLHPNLTRNSGCSNSATSARLSLACRPFRCSHNALEEDRWAGQRSVAVVLEEREGGMLCEGIQARHACITSTKPSPTILQVPAGAGTDAIMLLYTPVATDPPPFAQSLAKHVFR